MKKYYDWYSIKEDAEHDNPEFTTPDDDAIILLDIENEVTGGAGGSVYASKKDDCWTIAHPSSIDRPARPAYAFGHLIFMCTRF